MMTHRTRRPMPRLIRRHTRRTARPADAGMASVEALGYITLSLFAFTVAVQLVMWGLAALGAHYSANHAAQTARLYGSSADAGQADATDMLATRVGAALADTHTTVTRTPTTVTVTITGHAVTVVPGLHPPVTVTITVPAERTG
jgi:hypothetical protein